MRKISALGSSTSDLSQLAAALQSIVLLEETDLFDTVQLSQDNNKITLLSGDTVLFSWELSSGTATFRVYVSPTEYVEKTIGIGCPTFVIVCTGGIYIARNATLTADAHSSFVAITPSNSGVTAFTIGASASPGQFGNTVVVAYGDRSTPADNTTFTPIITKNCSAYYPVPTNCSFGSPNFTVNLYALAYWQYTLTTTGKTSIDGVDYYTNGYWILSDKPV